MDMGIEDFLIGSTLLGVLAQRLTRQLCNDCKEVIDLSQSVMDELKLPTNVYYYGAKGCGKCDFTGYSGRRAVGELFIMNDTVKTMMKDGLNDHQIRMAMKKMGMKTIADKLREMLIDGDTSYEECVRIGIMED
jgi:general secretion pathway protein E